jgi:DNA polymerase III delta subunit
VLLAARSGVLFAEPGERRVIVVEDVGVLDDAAFVRELPADVWLVLANEGALARRSQAKPGADRGRLAPEQLPALVEELGGQVEELPLLDEPELDDWLARRAEALGVTLGPEARRELVHSVGPDLERADHELEKLAAYAAGRTIGLADVRALVSGAVENDVFVLTRAVARGDTRAAVEMLERVLDDGEPPQRLIGLLTWQFRLLLAAGGARSDADLERAVTQMKLSRGALLRARREAPRLSRAAVTRAYETLYAADMAIKGGRADPRTALQLAILHLCGVEGAEIGSLADRPPSRF